MSRMPVEKGIIGKKIGMTQIFAENGNIVPVTVIEAGPCLVVQKKILEKDGYSAVQLGFIDIPEKKASKPKSGHFKKAGVPPKRHLKEFKFKNAESLNTGDKIDAELFKAGEKIDVTGLTKGHGFTGGVKRWNLHTQSESHGVGPVHRHSGSMGANSDPSRIMKNKKMPGQYGHEKVTIQNLEIIRIDAEKNLIAVKGAVPGNRGGIVFLRNSVKQ
jgi:large subunit ribosomal protein L3